jgi:DNA adenine methylase
MTTAVKTQPIKWHGGKSYLANWIISLMPARCKKPNAPSPDDPGWLHYVEAFFGGGAVLLAQDPEGISEVVNDLNYELTNFWCCLQTHEAFAEFSRRVLAIPVSQPEFEGADVEPPLTFDEIGGMTALAVNFFIRSRQSRQGLRRDFNTLSRNRTRGGMNEQASSWLGAIDGLPDVHRRLRRVVIMNDDAMKVIKQQDGPRTLFYCDPPYLHDTRTSTGEYGEQEMSEADHSRLLKTLLEIKGRFMLSGYHSALYDGVAKSANWQCHEREIDNKASSAKVKEKKTECVWTNY